MFANRFIATHQPLDCMTSNGAFCVANDLLFVLPHSSCFGMPKATSQPSQHVLPDLQRLPCRKSYEAGKVFGRRQTLWDALVTVIAGQERNAMGMLLKVVFSALVNFTIGMVSSIFVFVFKLPWIVADYKPGWVRFCAPHSLVSAACLSICLATFRLCVCFGWKICPPQHCATGMCI